MVGRSASGASSAGVPAAQRRVPPPPPARAPRPGDHSVHEERAMREYSSSEIRNVAVVGHGASGKTSLVDALAFVSGSSKRHGSVKDGTALTDYSPEEIGRGYSINLGLAHAEWMDTKINFIDTPGYADFQGDAIAGLAAADGALVVISATGGVEVGTERMFREALDRKDPALFVISLMDKENASFDDVYRQIKERLTPKVVPVEIPIGEGASFRGIINLFARKAYIYKKGTKTGEYDEVEIPAEEQERFDRYYQELIEAISATDDALLERYLEGVEIGRDEAIQGMKEAMKREDLFPLFCVSSELTYGLRALLTEIVQLMPSAYEMEELHAFKGAEGDRTVEIHARDDHPFAALVFKTVSEPHVGDVSCFRIFSGSVVNGQEVYNATRNVAEKLAHLSVSQGKERVEVPRLCAGDIGCVAKLRNTHTNDTLSTREHPVRLPQTVLPEPLVLFAVHAAARGEEEKLQSGLQRLHDEDPTFEVRYNPETHETIIAGIGERHLDVVMEKLRRKYGVRAEMTKPRIPYRETIKGKGEGQGRHKKQTGGRGQFGDCWVRFAPVARGTGYVFEDKIVGGVIPRQYIPAVDKGIQEAAQRGVVAGYPLVDFKVELFDGSYHSVDSNEMSFKMAGILAFKAVAPKCKPVLLEPLDEVEVVTPDEYLGDVMGDLSSRRGQILGTEQAGEGRGTLVRAVVPQAELHLYATDLSSMTQGRGRYSRRFRGYEEVPPDIAQRVAADSAKEQHELAEV
ncbi:MAG TPA: elongation factor G [Gemmatimonadaceae bacterium]|nr:elongation factor G [Gemmatimonadaceae bacterium]